MCAWQPDQLAAPGDDESDCHRQKQRKNTVDIALSLLVTTQQWRHKMRKSSISEFQRPVGIVVSQFVFDASKLINSANQKPNPLSQSR